MTRHSGVVVLFVLMAVSNCIPYGLPLTLPSSAQATVFEAVEVHRRAVQLYEQGKPREAIAVATKAVELLEDALGAAHIYVAVPLRSLAVFHQTQGAYAAAEPLYLRVLAIEEKALGSTDLGLVLPLDELAALYMQWGAPSKAEPLYARALAIRTRALGPTNAGVVESLNNLALAFEKQGAYRNAEPLYTRALALAERLLGPRHAYVARGLDGLARLYWAQGTYAQAEPLLVRALDIRQGLLADVTRFGPENISKIQDLFIPRGAGKPNRESAAYARVLGIYANTIAQINTHTLQSLSNLDQLYSATGMYARAEPLPTRTADIFETVLGSARSEVAQSSDHLIQLHVATGDYQRAEPLLVQTLDEQKQTLGPMHPDVANSLNDLAQLYQTQGAYAKAEPLLLNVLDIRQRTLGPNHPDVARGLNNLALLYMMEGAYGKAEPLLVRAVAMLEDALGKTHSDVARVLNNLALLHHVQGTTATAEPLYLRAIDIMSKAPGGAHPDTVRYLSNLAMLYHASGAHESAESLMARAEEMRESQLQLELVRLSASRKRALMALLRQDTESLVSLHVDSTPASASALGLALTAVLRRKGLALESLLDNQATLRSHLTPAIRTKLDQLAAASNELSILRHTPASPRTASSHAADIAALRTRIDTLESELNAASAALHARSQPVTPARIQAVLGRGTALLEFVRYRRFDPRPDQQRWHEARYAVYVLQRQQPPQWVALGEAAPIDAAVDAVLAQMRRTADANATRAALQHLDTLVLSPVRDQLAGISHIIVSPDSKLNLVPFEALIDPQGRYEFENRLVSYVTSGRDLLPRAARRAPRSPATIVAAPDYGPGRLFARLDAASAEASEVAAYFPDAKMLTGKRATKAAIAAIRGPAVLHVATHGFFARDAAVRGTSPLAAPPPRPPPLEALDALERDMFVEGVLAPTQLPTFEDPGEALDRAGLALADANFRPEGIVSAREIANYDWWGAQLVVLSACETGVGAVPSGDGVYGLRRALALAGAESQVVSLWSVNDQSVRALMREFYGELARGTGRAEALRRAKRWMLQQPKFAHPYYWAAFIPAGNWTPLDNTLIRQRRGGR